jgi:enoyl-CoA hydratase
MRITLSPVVDDDFFTSYFANLRDVWPRLGGDASVRAVVITSSAANFNPSQPEPNKQMLVSASLPNRAVRLLTLQQFAAQMLTFHKPVVAAVNGPAYGLGAQIAFYADAALATKDVVFGDTHVEHGLAAGDGGTAMWPVLVGVALARRLAVQGHRITAEEAMSLHLIEAVVEPERLLEAATATALRLADLPALAFMASKLAVNNWLRLSSLVAWDVSAAYEAAGLSQWDG